MFRARNAHILCMSQVFLALNTKVLFCEETSNQRRSATLFKAIKPPNDALTFKNQDGDILCIQYDTRTKNPRWVMEHLHQDLVRSQVGEGTPIKRPHFYTESRIRDNSFKVIYILICVKTTEFMLE